MTRVAYASIIGVMLLGALLLGCGALGLAVRERLVEEIGPIWIPPRTRYQIILRVGEDALPWDRRSGQGTAINVWAHDRRRENWHLVNLIHVPFGQPRNETSGMQTRNRGTAMGRQSAR